MQLTRFSPKERTLDDWRNMATTSVCRWCGVVLPETVLHHPHPGGWKVKGLPGLQWLYVRCVNCDYDWALWKLGVPGRAHE
jgi:hypothetical protein